MSQQAGNDQPDNPKSHVIGDVHATWLRRSAARVKRELYGVLLLVASQFLAISSIVESEI